MATRNFIKKLEARSEKRETRRAGAPVSSRFSLLLTLESPKNQTSVRSAETEAVGERVFDLHRPGFQGYVIGITALVGVFQVDGWRRDLVANRHHGDSGLQSARTSQQMAGHRFRGADGHLVSMVAESALDGHGFGPIAHIG